MNREKLYRETVDILLDAYNSGTLQKWNCYACAVGNIIAHRLDYKMTRTGKKHPILHWKGFPPPWTPDFASVKPDFASVKSDMWIQVCFDGKVNLRFMTPKMKEQLDSTGYTVYEIAKIEKAFEDGYNILEGLGNVIRVLGKIHKADISTTLRKQENLIKIHEGKLNKKEEAKCLV